MADDTTTQTDDTPGSPLEGVEEAQLRESLAREFGLLGEDDVAGVPAAPAPPTAQPRDEVEADDEHEESEVDPEAVNEDEEEESDDTEEESEEDADESEDDAEDAEEESDEESEEAPEGKWTAAQQEAFDRRVGKEVAKRKELEDRIGNLTAEVQELRNARPHKPLNNRELAVLMAEDEADIASFQDDMEKALSFYEEHWDGYEPEDPNAQPMTAAEIRKAYFGVQRKATALLQEARETLKQRKQVNAYVAQVMPEIDKAGSPENRMWNQFRSAPDKFLAKPGIKLAFAQMLIGARTMLAEQERAQAAGGTGKPLGGQKPGVKASKTPSAGKVPPKAPKVPPLSGKTPGGKPVRAAQSGKKKTSLDDVERFRAAVARTGSQEKALDEIIEGALAG